MPSVDNSVVEQSPGSPSCPRFHPREDKQHEPLSPLLSQKDPFVSLRKKSCFGESPRPRCNPPSIL